MKAVNLGLVGVGSIGVRHIQAIDKVDEISLVAIADPSPVAAEFGKARSIPVYADAESMFQAGGMDAVIISTPTEKHHKIVMVALTHHLTVLVEKPISATVEEARDITRFANEQGCHVLVGHQRRYYPCAEKARDIIQSGQLGTLMAVIGQWTARKDDPYYAPEWRREVEAGPILTNLIHEIDLLRFICGDITTVSAEITHHDQKCDWNLFTFRPYSHTLDLGNGAW